MEEANDIAELGDMLHRLRATDRTFRIFGSEAHRYSLRQTLSLSELSAFESTNRIRLPDDYRRFLAVFCNGLAGPFYGLTPLASGHRNLSRPFPLTKDTSVLAEEEYGRLLPDTAPEWVCRPPVARWPKADIGEYGLNVCFDPR